MNISAALVKDLREKTGVGMMDCKAALIENNGDMEAAIDWLRAKGLAKAAKKAGRVAAEGLVGVAVKGTTAAVVEVNSETDFVARNDAFQALVRAVAAIAVENGGDHAATAAAAYPGKAHSVEAEVKELVATIGENMNFRRSAALTVSAGVVAPYVHAAIADGLGKIGVLVALESTGNADELTKLGRQVAMHVAATNPLALSAEDVDPAVVERERAIFVEQAKESGKPAQVIEKMVEGRIRKFYEESTLLKQAFVINPDLTVEAAVKAAEATVGAPIKVTGFVRFALGEGIEKEETDFAAEVAAAAGTK
ncbi:translation elongation factor Ts [Oharaeibacter diazotrophicus]|uniref:Elongation factor Ts n=1 Tax=Oharaeibacter diazotrophicus TaxID=1920512 RepID=A0A4R6RLS7_9HYPH|nr:translation elongation factor Ts [Oharaeibacter diazotrophicus]TDP87500.1 elongation factor Ts [Oharaeibacter diazotrophicus]BBE70556.1 elongation factor Ts [Pleomorphomonas sp. SM30]GLS77302.1 elongation factor Ts [Oharaeibacter diazotrophicus]